MRRDGPRPGVQRVVGLAISLALHALVFTPAFTQVGALTDMPNPPAHKQKVTGLAEGCGK